MLLFDAHTHLHSGIKIVELFGFISEDPTLCMCAYVHESAATEYGSVCPILMEKCVRVYGIFLPQMLRRRFILLFVYLFPSSHFALSLLSI